MLRNIQRNGPLSSVAARLPVAAIAISTTPDEISLPDGQQQSNTPRRKPVARAEDNFHNRPAVVRMREDSGLVYRLWKNGAYIEDLRWRYKVPAKAVEDVLRERAAA